MEETTAITQWEVLESTLLAQAIEQVATNSNLNVNRIALAMEIRKVLIFEAQQTRLCADGSSDHA